MASDSRAWIRIEILNMIFEQITFLTGLTRLTR